MVVAAATQEGDFAVLRYQIQSHEIAIKMHRAIEVGYVECRIAEFFVTELWFHDEGSPGTASNVFLSRGESKNERRGHVVVTSSRLYQTLSDNLA